MTLLPAARLLSECAFYYTLLLIFPMAPEPWLLLGTAVLCGLGCSAAGAMGEKTLLRCLTAVIPLGAALLPGSNVLRICMAVPIAYTLLLIFTGRVYADAWTYARHVKFSLIFELLLLVIGCTLRTERALQLLAWGNVFFIFGVYFQHQLRLGGGVDLRSKLRDFAGISILPLGSGAVVGLVAGGLEPIGKAVMAFAGGVGWIMSYVVSFCTNLYHNPKIEIAKVTVAATEATEATIETTTEGFYPETWPEMDVTPGMLWGLVAAGILALLGLLAYGVYRFERRPTSGRSEQDYVQAEGTVAVRTEQTVQRSGSNRRRVRKIYSNYLRLMQGRGMLRHLHDTSRDVLESAGAYSDPRKGGDLRRIYIRARYRTDAPVTDEDVQAAGQLLKEIKKDAASRP